MRHYFILITGLLFSISSYAENQVLFVEAHTQSELQGHISNIIHFQNLTKNNFYGFVLKKYQASESIKRNCSPNAFIAQRLENNTDYQFDYKSFDSLEDCKTHLKNPNSVYQYKKFKITNQLIPQQRAILFTGEASEAIDYEFEVEPVSIANKNLKTKTYHNSMPQVLVEASPGEFKVRTRKKLKNLSISLWSDYDHFYMSYDKVPNLVPVKGTQIPSYTPNKALVELQWPRIPGAKFYSVYIYNQNKKLIIQERPEQNFLNIELKNKSKYYWFVKAHTMKREVASITEDEKSLPENQAISDFSISEYKLKNTLNYTGPLYYYWPRFNVSNIIYSGDNQDFNANMYQPGLGNEIEIHFGQEYRKSNFTWNSHFAMTSMNLAGQNYFYFSLGADAGIHRTLGHAGEYRILGGLRYHEIPEEYPATPNTDLSISRLKSIGPEIILKMNDRFIGNFGWEFFGIGYYALADLSSPARSSMKLSSFNLGIYATWEPENPQLWHFNRHRWLAGISHKTDNLSYSPTTNVSGSNVINISSDNVSISLEVGL